MVGAVLSLDGDFDQRMIQCRVFSQFGKQSVIMQTIIDIPPDPVISPTSLSENIDSATVSFTLRVLTQDCDKWNVSLIFNDEISC